MATPAPQSDEENLSVENNETLERLRERDTQKNIELSKELLESVRLSLKGRQSKPVHLFKINQ